MEGGLRVLIVPARRLGRSPAIGSAAVAYEFKLPDLGEGLTEGEVARWLVSEGDEVAEDQPLVEIQTDKTTVEIPSPAAGKVAQILVEEGSVVPVGTVLVVIGEDGAVPRAEPQSAKRPRRRVRGTGPRTWLRGTCPGDAARATAGAGARRRPRVALRDRAAGPRHRAGRARRHAGGGRDRPRDGASRCAECGA